MISLNIELCGHRITDFFNLCRPYISNLLADTPGDNFAFFYGSYAYKTASKDSDLDLLVVCDNANEDQKTKIKEFIFDLHRKYNIPLDFDIPYEIKLMRSLDFMRAACSGEGLLDVNGAWSIKPFTKEPGVLTSESFLKRFFVGMMANPHIFITGNYSLYQELRLTATRNLIRAVLSINNTTIASVNDIITLLCGSHERTGEMFLGFPQTFSCKAYLAEYINIVLSSMEAQISHQAHDIVYEFDDKDLLTAEEAAS